MFGLSQKILASFCTQLATMLTAGLPISRALAVLSRSGRGARVKQAARLLDRDIQTGSTFSQALRHRGNMFPPLVIQLTEVGEDSGALDNVLKQLGEYYEMLCRLRKEFIARIALPVLEIIAAVFVLGVIRYVMVMLGDNRALSPTAEALKVMGKGYGAIAGVVLIYYFVTRVLGASHVVHEILMHVPVVRYVHQSLALARFSWSLQLMLEAGAPVDRSIERALMATNNGAFQARTKRMLGVIQNGEGLDRAMEAAGLFPLDYIEIIRIAQESGSMTDSLQRLSRQNFEKSEQAMRLASTALGVLIVICVIAILGYMVLTMAMKYYIGPMKQTMDEMYRK